MPYTNTKFSKTFLMSGRDLPLTDRITLHHPTVGEVWDLGSPFPDRIYWSYVQLLLTDPYSRMVALDDMGKNYLETSPYEVFLMQWDSVPPQLLSRALGFFLAKDLPTEDRRFERGLCSDGSVCLYDTDNPACRINREIFEYLYEWVKAINKIDHSERIKPADENARRVLIADARENLKKASRRKTKEEDELDSFGNFLSAVSFCGNGTLPPSGLGSCRLYWLNEALSVHSRKNHADHLLDGIYHGTVRSADVNRKELDWINHG